jgi:hypothetical protein
MKLIYISGRPFNGRINRAGLCNTNDIAIAWCLGARDHMEPMIDIRLLDADSLMVTLWQVRLPGERRWMNVAWEWKQAHPDKKLILYQESEFRWPQYRSWVEQKELYELLQITDLMLCHNEADAKFYGLLMQNPAKAIYFPAVQDLRMIEQCRTEPQDKTTRTVLVQHFDNRSNGLFAALIAKKVGAPILHFNTSIYPDNRNEEARALFGLDMTDLANTGWLEWARAIGRAWVYLHPLTVCGAGRDTIACAVLGVPVIGNRHLEAQRILFPDLKVDIDEPDEMEAILRRLLTDQGFYTRSRLYAFERWQQFTIEAGEELAGDLLKRLEWN